MSLLHVQISRINKQLISDLLTRPVIACPLTAETFGILSGITGQYPIPVPIPDLDEDAFRNLVQEVGRQGAESPWRRRDVVERILATGNYIDWQLKEALLVPSDAVAIQFSEELLRATGQIRQDNIEILMKTASDIGYCAGQIFDGYSWLFVFDEALRSRVGDAIAELAAINRLFYPISHDGSLMIEVRDNDLFQ